MKNKSEKKKPKGADKSNSYTQHFKSLYDKRIAEKELKDKTFPVAKY